MFVTGCQIGSKHIWGGGGRISNPYIYYIATCLACRAMCLACFLSWDRHRAETQGQRKFQGCKWFIKTPPKIAFASCLKGKGNRAFRFRGALPMCRRTEKLGADVRTEQHGEGRCRCTEWSFFANQPFTSAAVFASGGVSTYAQVQIFFH